jgi:DNA-binding response OmpR family regulator
VTTTPLRVLVVDDEPPIRRFLRTSLGAQGYHVLEENDGITVRIYIRSVRLKIEPDPERPQHVVTETGVGYRLRELPEKPEENQERPNPEQLSGRTA